MRRSRVDPLDRPTIRQLVPGVISAPEPLHGHPRVTKVLKESVIPDVMTACRLLPRASGASISVHFHMLPIFTH